MKFEEWLDQKFNVDNLLPSEEYPEEELLRQKMMENKESVRQDILDSFKQSTPKFVIFISRETFQELPRKNGQGWLDFSVIEQWRIENTTYESLQHDAATYIFANEIDASAFKLKWG